MFFVLDILHWVCLGIATVHTVCTIANDWGNRGKLHNLRYELLPFAWIVALYIAIYGGPIKSARGIMSADTDHSAAAYVIVGLIIFALWAHAARAWYRDWKKSDDDRWKKRRKRLAGKVKEVAGKLVVEPEPELVRVTA